MQHGLLTCDNFPFRFHPTCACLQGGLARAENSCIRLHLSFLCQLPTLHFPIDRFLGLLASFMVGGAPSWG